MMKRSVSASSKKRYVSILLGILCIGIAVFLLWHMQSEYKESDRFYQKLEGRALKKDAGSQQSKQNEQNEQMVQKAEDSEKQASAADTASLEIDFDSLKQVNGDIIGWILFDNNGISYPILQGKDNEKYLYRLADGTKSKAGSIFMDAACSPDFSDAHTIIYGHNMKNLSMFGKLKWYRTKRRYYENNRYFTIYTPDQVLRYEIFSWYEANADDMVYQVGFWPDGFFLTFVEEMVKRSSRNTGVTVDENDKIVTLSTCSANGKRFVVHGKLCSYYSDASLTLRCQAMRHSVNYCVITAPAS